MIELTAENVTDALKFVVNEKGENFVYVNDFGVPMVDSDGTRTHANCQYVHMSSGEPMCGCIVATALNHLGVPLSAILPYEGDAAHQVLNNLVTDGIIGMCSFDDPSRDILQRAQESQDKGNTWGKALEYALSVN